MRQSAFLGFALALACSAPLCAQAGETYDLVILGGRVIDPETKRDEVAVVGINGRRVARISLEPLQGRKTLNARGLVVAPGFVDLHAHGQHDVGQQFQVLDGVTTAIDAESAAMPVAPYFAASSAEENYNEQ